MTTHCCHTVNWGTWGECFEEKGYLLSCRIELQVAKGYTRADVNILYGHVALTFFSLLFVGMTYSAINIKGCDAGSFPWSYSDSESCYLLQGKVTVTPTDGRQAVTFGKGDFVTFPAGMSCQWDVAEPVKKHFNFF